MFYHEYSLTACGPLNARAAEVCRKGALIKTDEGGYGCIQPWPELGDATLQEELDALRKGNPLPLGIRALECARTDGEARAKGASLFDGLHIIGELLDVDGPCGGYNLHFAFAGALAAAKAIAG